MSKYLKIATILVILGLVIFLAVMIFNGFNLGKIFKKDYQTNTHNITDDFKDISLSVDTADISFLKSDDGKCKIECYEDSNNKHAITVENNTLIIRVNEKKWYQYLFDFGTPKLIVYLPENAYKNMSIVSDTSDIEIPADFFFNSIDIDLSTGDVKNYASAKEYIKIKASTGNIQSYGSAEESINITTSTGDITVDNISTTKISLIASTGKITVSKINCSGRFETEVDTGRTILTDVKCGSLNSVGTTGKINLTNVIADEKIYIERDTGNVTLDGVDGGEIQIITSTGDVKGSLLSDKIFIVDTSTGKKQVPETVSGGKCKITTSTGDIIINIK